MHAESMCSSTFVPCLVGVHTWAGWLPACLALLLFSAHCACATPGLWCAVHPTASQHRMPGPECIVLDVGAVQEPSTWPYILTQCWSVLGSAASFMHIPALPGLFTLTPVSPLASHPWYPPLPIKCVYLKIYMYFSVKETKRAAASPATPTPPRLGVTVHGSPPTRMRPWVNWRKAWGTLRMGNACGMQLCSSSWCVLQGRKACLMMRWQTTAKSWESNVHKCVLLSVCLDPICLFALSKRCTHCVTC